MAEIESVAKLAHAIRAGVGATIMPWSSVSGIASAAGLVLRRVTGPAIELKISLCTPDQRRSRQNSWMRRQPSRSDSTSVA